MKWFKHFSCAQNDSGLMAVKDKFGFEGIGRFWCIMEVLAENGTGGTFSVEWPIRAWRELLGFKKVDTTKMYMLFIADKTGMKITLKDSSWIVSQRNMSKYRDNYTKDLQASSKEPARDLAEGCSQEKETEKEVDTDSEKETNKEKKSDLDFSFSKFPDLVSQVYQFAESPSFEHFKNQIVYQEALYQNCPGVFKQALEWFAAAGKRMGVNALATRATNIARDWDGGNNAVAKSDPERGWFKDAAREVNNRFFMLGGMIDVAERKRCFQRAEMRFPLHREDRLGELRKIKQFIEYCEALPIQGIPCSPDGVLGDKVVESIQAALKRQEKAIAE